MRMIHQSIPVKNYTAMSEHGNKILGNDSKELPLFFIIINGREKKRSILFMTYVTRNMSVL